MKKTNFEKALSLIVCIVLIAAMALMTSGCKNNKTEDISSSVAVVQQKAEFDFTVVHKDGSEKAFKIVTTKQTVGEALKDEQLIAGDEGAFGIYVKTVDGETLNYDTDGYWWALYKGDEQLMTGADQTPIEDGKTYTFKAEKA